jgi:regulator of RNase E activity RraB
MGFQLLGKLPDARSGNLPFGLQIVREDFVHPPFRIDSVVARLLELADQHHGEYDGWGCEIVI